MNYKLHYVAYICLVAGFLSFFKNLSQPVGEEQFSSIAERPAKIVCSITINSDDEIKIFKEKLASSGEFQFKEFINGQNQWFDQACESGVKCDVLVISGHFGGTFFGKSGHHLSLSQLESKSCSKKCQGVLENPKEVYLFGCNTLASKQDEDGRTPEQYLQVLLEDGLERSFAERVVEARMGVTGEESLNRMRRAFPGVPAIYGFCKKAPLGEEAGPLLRKYFGATSHEYYDRIDNLEQLKRQQPYSVDTLNKMNNVQLGSLFKSIGRCFRQTPGIDSSDDVSGKICYIRDQQNPIESRAQYLNSLMKSEKALSYIELCNDFFNEVEKKQLDSNQIAAINQLKNNQKLRTEIVQILDKISFFMSYEYSVLANRLGVDKNQIKPILTASLVRLLNKPSGITQEELNLIYNLNIKNPMVSFIDLRYGQLAESVWRDHRAIAVLGYTQTKDVNIVNRLKQNLQSDVLLLKSNSAFSLVQMKIVDAEVVRSLASLLVAPNADIRSTTVDLLTQLQIADDFVVDAIINANRTETDNWTKKKIALFFVTSTLRSNKINQELVRMLADSYWETRYYASLAFTNRDLNEDYIVEALMNLTNDQNLQVSSNAIFALRKSSRLISPRLKDRLLKEFPAVYKQMYN